MVGQNIRYWRLRRDMTRAGLSRKSGLPARLITAYENCDENPDMQKLTVLANALDVRVLDFLAERNDSVSFSHGEFRKISGLTKNRQEYVQAAIEEYFGRFYTAMELMPDNTLPKVPKTHIVPFSGNIENAALAMRFYVGLPLSGPIGNLVELVESLGILVCFLDLDGQKMDSFSGENGEVNGRPYIAVNRAMQGARNRATIAHELAHILFSWPNTMSEKEIERNTTAIAGAFLFPADDVRKVFSVHESYRWKLLENIGAEFGVSAQLAVKRAAVVGAISKFVEAQLFKNISSLGWRKQEPSRVPQEESTLLEKFVRNALRAGEISVSRGAELLGVPLAKLISK